MVQNTVFNPYGHIAMGVGNGPLVGLNPVSDFEFADDVAMATVGCYFGLACDPLAIVTVPGVISPQLSGEGVEQDRVSMSISADQGIAIQTAIQLSKDNPPYFSVKGPQPACDCASWAQRMLGFGGIASGPGTWEPAQLMKQLEQ